MFKRIMIPLDGSELAQSALPHALELGQALGATVLLFYVRNPRSGSVEAARRFLAYVRDQQTKTNVVIEILVGEGPVAAAIIEAADQERIDLIVMATHGRSGMQRVVYGSVAAQVLRSSSRPILLVRAPGAQVEALA